MLERYVKKILASRVYDVAIESPLHEARSLSRALNNRVFLKREDLQSVFSFKLRGAYNKMAQLSAEDRARGVIAASAGNHAQGVALAANRLGVKAHIVMGRNTPDIKVSAVRDLGARVILHGDNFDEARDHANELDGQARLHLRASVRRPRRDRWARHCRYGDPQSAQRAAACDLRSGGRRRIDLGHRRVRQVSAQRREDHRRRGGRFCVHGRGTRCEAARRAAERDARSVR